MLGRVRIRFFCQPYNLLYSLALYGLLYCRAAPFSFRSSLRAYIVGFIFAMRFRPYFRLSAKILFQILFMTRDRLRPLIFCAKNMVQPANAPGGPFFHTRNTARRQ